MDLNSSALEEHWPHKECGTAPVVTSTPNLIRVHRPACERRCNMSVLSACSSVLQLVELGSADSCNGVHLAPSTGGVSEEKQGAVRQMVIKVYCICYCLTPSKQVRSLTLPVRYQLATIRAEGRPANRTVVHRGFLGNTDRLLSISDIRRGRTQGTAWL